MPDSVGARLVRAIAEQDASALGDCFSSDVHVRALTPPGVRERKGAHEAAAMISSWFADSTELDLVDSGIDDVAGRLHVSYRFEGVEEGEPYVVEQHLYCTLRDGKIASADLLCSGFLTRAHVTS
jgi:ketosteroid isomerase-like protein